MVAPHLVGALPAVAQRLLDSNLALGLLKLR
jgi:hypothetical protein